MFTVLVFKSISQAIIFYTVLFAILGTIAYFVYKKAVSTRKYYKCTSCNESFRTELMDAQTCKVCGASLELIDDKEVSDKAL